MTRERFSLAAIVIILSGGLYLATPAPVAAVQGATCCDQVGATCYFTLGEQVYFQNDAYYSSGSC